MREIALWRWIFGLALVPTAGWAWLTRDLYPDGGPLDLPLSLLPAYAASLLIVGALALAWLALAGLVRDAVSFIRELLGFRAGP